MIIKTFPDSVKIAVGEAQHGMCAIEGCYEPIHSFHHCKHNTIPNNKLYPLFLHSIFNCKGSCLKHHEHYAIWNISDDLAEAFENWLRKFLTEMPF